MWSLLASLLSLSTALEPITIDGNAFYQGDDRFYIRGVAYQEGGSSNLTDPLADVDGCKRDVQYFKDLGLNTIRVYTVDNSANHDECMEVLADAGIYLLLDVSTPDQSLNRQNESTLAVSYNSGFLQHVFATIDAFKDYDNVLGFFASNEVINNDETSVAAPYIKATVRDMKEYIQKHSNRTIPVGYSAADISSNRWQQMTYLNCGNDSERIDMFGMNDYSWCGVSSFEQSGWASNVQQYANYSIPLFLSEYGCNDPSPRLFDEVPSLYSTDMSSVYSGGLVYEYWQAANNYGLVELDSSGDIEELDDYSTFKNKLNSTSDPSGDGGADLSGGAMECPAFESGVWEVEANATIPDTPTYAKSLIESGAGKPLGFNGPNTQSGSELDNPDSDDSDSSTSSSASASSTSSADSSSTSSVATTSSTSSSSTSTSASSTSSSSSASSSSSSSSSSSRSSSSSKDGVEANTPFLSASTLLLMLLAYI